MVSCGPPLTLNKPEKNVKFNERSATMNGRACRFSSNHVLYGSGSSLLEAKEARR